MKDPFLLPCCHRNIATSSHRYMYTYTHAYLSTELRLPVDASTA